MKAVQKKAFNRISADDQAVVREEMGKVFERMDKLNREDNAAAKKALQQQGITFVRPSPGEAERWRDISIRSIDDMVTSGVISAEFVSQVMSHLQSYRDSR